MRQALLHFPVFPVSGDRQVPDRSRCKEVADKHDRSDRDPESVEMQTLNEHVC